MTHVTNTGQLRDMLPMTAKDLGDERFRCPDPECDCSEVEFKLKCHCRPRILYDREERALLLICDTHHAVMKVKVAES